MPPCASRSRPSAAGCRGAIPGTRCATASSGSPRARRSGQNELAFEFGIFGPDSTDVWGGVGINQINRTYNFGNLGFWVRASRVRQGVAIAAARLAARFAFRELALTRVELVALVDNIASRRVAEKLGATFECVARNRLVHNGVPFAAAVYSLIPGDIPG